MNIKQRVLLILVLLFVGASATTFYFYQKVDDLKADPNEVAQKRVAELVNRVSKIIVLPEGETPTVVTVNDPEQLKDQTFFAKAKVGDQVLLYTTARKAYLYDPVNNKILEIAPLEFDPTGRVAPVRSEVVEEGTQEDIEENPPAGGDDEDTEE